MNQPPESSPSGRPGARRFGTAEPVGRSLHDGILLVDKPSGPTSHDVVARVRHLFRFEKVGHGGTLDPQATGLLIVLLGRGTKLSDRIMASDKTYEGTLRLGIETDSHDCEGAVMREADWSAVTREDLLEQFRLRTGDLLQIPPMVSAVKKGGTALYKLARRGQTVEREARAIRVHAFELLDFAPPRARFVLRCTKGTYVRTLCHEIGQTLGCGGILDALRRTQSGPWSVEQALDMERIGALDREGLLPHIIPIHTVLQALHEQS